MAGNGAGEVFGDQIERGVPGDRFELPRTFCTSAPQRHGETIRVMDAFGIARDLGTHYAIGVRLVSPVHTPDAGKALRTRVNLDLERADARAVVRADARKLRRSSSGIHGSRHPDVSEPGTPTVLPGDSKQIIAVAGARKHALTRVELN